jgi:cysteinyl-tRNA synthetase
MKNLRVWNTYAKSFEAFASIAPRRVLIYSCGPTVYSYAHIGNFRSFLMADLLRRVLERDGFEVRHVMNITDVGHMTQDHLADATGEDKLAKAARELGKDPFEVASHFERAFVDDAKQLRMKNYLGAEANDRSLHPRATDHIPEMLAMIQTLLDRDYAYTDGRGQVYFQVSKFPDYGALSGKEIENLSAGARVPVRSEKRDPRDFALWKVDEKHLMQWDPRSPRGWAAGEYERLEALVPQGVSERIKPGFPGWHLECSAMARAHLAPVIDIHTGGEDNIFPHHECEIAQSYCAAPEVDAPKNFARYWLHARHLLVDGRKMSKRDGTFFTVRDLLDPRASGRPELAEQLKAAGFPDARVSPNVLRYALISNLYTQPMNFTFDLLTQANVSVERMQSRYDRLREVAGPGEASPAVRTLLAACAEAFDDALRDNLNTPNALAAVFRLVTELNQIDLSPGDGTAALAVLEGFDSVLDVLDRRVRTGMVLADQTGAWLDPARRAQRVANLAHWATRPDLVPILETLREGGLPRAEAFASVQTLDQELVELVVSVRARAKQQRDFVESDALRS